MSSNDKEYQRKYMRRQRLPDALRKIINSLQECVKEYAKTLRECVKDGEAEPLRVSVKESIEPLQVCVKDLFELQKPLQVCVKDSQGENGEIRSKTQVLPGNGEISDASLVLVGGRGAISINNSIKSNNSIIGILTDVEVKRGLGTKEKTYKKEKFSKNFYSADFEIFYRHYPNKSGKSPAFKRWERFKRAGSLPDLFYLLACVAILKRSSGWQNEDGRYIPMCSTWVGNRRWEDLDEAKVKEYIEKEKAWKARQEEERAMAEKEEAEKKNRMAKEQAECEREKAESLEKLKRAAIPSFNEWDEFDISAKHNFCVSLGLPQVTIFDILDEVLRREKQPAADVAAAAMEAG